jgi:cell wall-associated NlpC family hydrolase
MSIDRGFRGATDRALGIRIAAPLALVLALLTSALVAPAARADTIAQKRQEANRVYDEIVASQQQLEGVIQKYDQATQLLHTTNHAISFNNLQLRRAKHNLSTSQRDLAGALIASYKQGQPDALQAVLASKSLSQMFDEINLMKRATTFNATTVLRIRSYKLEVVHREAALAREHTRRTQAVAAQRARQVEIQSAIHEQQQTLANVKSDIRRLIYERQQAERAAVRARALAAARALQREQSQATVQSTQTSGLTQGLGAVADSLSQPVTSSDAGSPDTSSSDATQSAPPASAAAAQAVQIALGEQGVPYVWGGSSPSGFDCSGLVSWAYGQVGISLPHYTGSLWNVGTHVSVDQLEPGDLVFFHGESHVGMYIGGGQFVQAPHTGDVVKVSSLSDPWYSSGYDGAVRVS